LMDPAIVRREEGILVHRSVVVISRYFANSETEMTLYRRVLI
jgi:hypothetical protein